jgi:hypothetical protein
VLVDDRHADVVALADRDVALAVHASRGQNFLPHACNVLLRKA